MDILKEFTKRIGRDFKQTETVCKEIAEENGLDPDAVMDEIYTRWDVGYGVDAEKIEDEGEE